MSTVALAAFAGATVLLGGGPLRAANYTWTVSSGDWSTASNWGETIPTGSDTAYIVSGGTANVTQPGETCSTLSLGGSAGSGTVQMSGGGLAVTDYQYVGYSGAGTFIQSGGANTIGNQPAYGNLYLGYNAGSSGVYSLSGSSLLSAYSAECVGYSGTGAFSQSGGTNSTSQYGSLYLGNVAGGSGTYNLSGSGLLSTPTEAVGDYGMGIFTQSGGTNSSGSYLYLGQYAGSSGTYGLGGNGRLSVAYEYVGAVGSGTFMQSGGTHTIGNWLELGGYSGGSGTYSLSGSGCLSAPSEYVGYAAGATALFQQTGGTNTLSRLSIGGSSTYQLAGGALQVNGNLLNQGILSGGDTPAALSFNGILDLSNGTWQNLGAITLSMSANSLLIVPPGFNPSTGFATGSTLGLVHTTGSTLFIPAGQGFSGSDSIGDPVNCQGTIMAPSGGTINLSGGLTLSGTGTINLGSGNLTTNNLASALSGGSLAAANHYVGNGGTGSFTQTGGTNSFKYLYLGYNAGDSGTYNLSGSGYVPASPYGYEYVGCSGSGTFTQPGGTNSVNSLYLGYASGGSGTYKLSGSGGLTATGTEYLGYSGTAAFTQSGGTHSANILYLGYNSSSSGTYSLSGGPLSALYEYVGESGSGSFTQSGGTNSIGDYLYLGVNAGSSGAYSLSGSGLMSIPAEYVGLSGTGSFTQSAGTHTIGSTLYLGYNSSSSGTYGLSGNGQLSAASEYVGYNPGAGGLFQQSGGSNTTTSLLVGSGGCYQLGGGTLQVSGGFFNAGIVDGQNTPATLVANCLLDLTGGTWTNLSAMSLSMGTNSLLIVPPGFSLATFANHSCLGLIHTAGSTLTVPAAQGFTGCGTIGDPVNCQGSITASSSGFINLNGGLTLSGNATVNLGSGTLTINATSTMSGGQLSAGNYSIGNGGTGSFTQTGGTNIFANRNGCLYLGYGPGDSGTYNLGGTALLSAQSTDGCEYVGYSGTGTFTQSGGTHTLNASATLCLGNYAGSSGTYSLSGASLLTAPYLYVGCSGAGNFTQWGATNTGYWLLLGSATGGSGTYALSGSGLLSETNEFAGYNGSGNFTQSGGTNTLSYFLYLGEYSGSSGSYSLSGSGRLTDQQVEYVGASGTGSFTQSGGTNSVIEQLCIGESAGGNGVYNLNGGLLVLASLTKGSGTAAFNFNGGTLQASSGFSTSLPMTLGASGSGATFDTAGYAVTLSGSLSGPGSLTKVDSGTLTLAAGNTFSGNTLVSGGTLVLANAAALQNSTLDTSGSGSLNFGSLTSATFGGLTGPGTLALSNTTSTAIALTVGNNNVSTTYTGALNGPGSVTKIGLGTLLLTGSNSYTGGTTVSAGTLQIGNGGNTPDTVAGTIVLAGGALTFNYSGSNFQVNSNLTLLAGATLGNLSNNQINFNPSFGTLTGNGQTLTVCNGTSSAYLYFNQSFGNALGQINIIAGSVGEDSNPGQGSNGVNGGLPLRNAPMVISSGAQFDTYDSPTINNQITLNGGAGPNGKGALQNQGEGAAIYSGTLILASGTSTIGTGGGNITITGPIAGAGGLTEIGGNTLILTAAETYTGPTTISQGKLVVDGSLTNSTVGINSGGTLSGSGYLGSVTVNPGGNLTPGDGLGALNVSGNLVLASSSVMDYDLDTPTTSSMIIAGALTLNGQQFNDFNFTPTANFVPGNYDLIQFGSLSGSLGTSTTGTIDGYPASLSIQGNDLVLSVPEPATLALLASGVLGLIGWAWRQRGAARTTAQPAAHDGQLDFWAK